MHNKKLCIYKQPCRCKFITAHCLQLVSDITILFIQLVSLGLNCYLLSFLSCYGYRVKLTCRGCPEGKLYIASNMAVL